jgi:uncharacterized protein (DUF58 family)
MPPPTRYLDPAALARLRNLGFAARLVVEGLYAGQHRSPRRGSSVEFAEHRPYTPGVDPRHLDWKILARRDRLYVKQYEEQTALRCHLVLDCSGSMAYRHEAALTKLEYACYCAASLAYLMLRQHDAVGLITCNDRIVHTLPPRQGRGHLSEVLERLEGLEAGGPTDLASTFHSLAKGLKRRGLIVVLSDMFNDAGGDDRTLEALAHLRHRKHEVVVLQVLDHAELEFPFRDVSQIEDMETGASVAADAEAIRNHYLAEIRDFLDSTRTGCAAHGIEYALADTSQPFDLFLGAYLSRRQGMSRVQ